MSTTSLPITVSGPITLTEYRNDEQKIHVYIFGDRPVSTDSSSSSCPSSIPIADLIVDTARSNHDKIIDVYLESTSPRTGRIDRADSIRRALTYAIANGLKIRLHYAEVYNIVESMNSDFVNYISDISRFTSAIRQKNYLLTRDFSEILFSNPVVSGASAAEYASIFRSNEALRAYCIDQLDIAAKTLNYDKISDPRILSGINQVFLNCTQRVQQIQSLDFDRINELVKLMNSDDFSEERVKEYLKMLNYAGVIKRVNDVSTRFTYCIYKIALAARLRKVPMTPGQVKENPSFIIVYVNELQAENYKALLPSMGYKIILDATAKVYRSSANSTALCLSLIPFELPLFSSDTLPPPPAIVPPSNLPKKTAKTSSVDLFRQITANSSINEEDRAEAKQTLNQYGLGWLGKYVDVIGKDAADA